MSGEEMKGSAPGWRVESKRILGWISGDRYYCRGCARERGLSLDAGLSQDSGFVPEVQEDLPLPHLFRLTPCSGGCGTNLAKPMKS